MIKVYYKTKKNQVLVNYKSMTNSDYVQFQNDIADKKIKAYIVGIEISFINEILM